MHQLAMVARLQILDTEIVQMIGGELRQFQTRAQIGMINITGTGGRRFGQTRVGL
jgi:hypothetical protein